MPNILVWPTSAPTWVTTATTTSNTIVWQTWASTPSTTFNPLIWYQPPRAFEYAEQQRQLRQMYEANMAYQNQLNQQRQADLPPWAEQERRDYAATEAARVIEPRREVAAARARELLLQHLNEEQRASFLAHKWFVVEGGRTKRKYRIRDKGDVVANVDALDPHGNVVARLCAHGRHDFQLPLADHLLTQKITLELDEDAFLRVANRH